MICVVLSSRVSPGSVHDPNSPVTLSCSLVPSILQCHDIVKSVIHDPTSGLSMVGRE